MQDIELTAPAPADTPRVPRLDTILTVIVWALLAAILGLGGWFGYTVWSTQNQARLSTPALRAIEALKLQARQHPGDIAVRIRLGEAYAQAGMLDQGVQQLNEALKINKNHTGALLDLGLLSWQKQQYKTSEVYFQKVVDLTDGADYNNVNQQRETALYYLGEIAMKANRYEDAVGWFKAALRIRRDAADTYLELSAAYKGMGELDAAIKQLEIALQYDPTYAQAFYQMGQIYAAKKDTVNAAAAYAKAAELAPDAVQPKEALAALGTAEEWQARAMASFKANKLDQAIDEILVARVLSPKDVGLAKLQAQIAEKKGDPKGALEILKQAQELAPDDKDVQAAVKRLSATER